MMAQFFYRILIGILLASVAESFENTTQNCENIQIDDDHNRFTCMNHQGLYNESNHATCKSSNATKRVFYAFSRREKGVPVTLLSTNGTANDVGIPYPSWEAQMPFAGGSFRSVEGIEVNSCSNRLWVLDNSVMDESYKSKSYKDIYLGCLHISNDDISNATQRSNITIFDLETNDTICSKAIDIEGDWIELKLFGSSETKANVSSAEVHIECNEKCECTLSNNSETSTYTAIVICGVITFIITVGPVGFFFMKRRSTGDEPHEPLELQPLNGEPEMPTDHPRTTN